MEPIRVYLICEYRILGELLAKTFEQRFPGIHLQGAAASFSPAMEALAERPVEILMIDVRVGRDLALEMVGEFRARFVDLSILPFGLSSEDQVLKFLECGASSYLLSDATVAAVLASFDAIRRGEPDFSPRITASVCSRIAELSWERKGRRVLPRVELTPRETEVLTQIADGNCNKEIARNLAIKVATVKNHVHKILEKLQVRSRRQAIRRAIENGILANPLPLAPCRRVAS